MTHSFGPWATTLGVHSRAGLTSFWKKRMTMLSTLDQSKIRASRLGTMGVFIAAVMIALVPVIRFASALGQEQASAIRGKNYVLAPWKKTELQMWLIGSAGDPKENCNAYVLIDGHSFYGEGGRLERESLDWDELAKQLRPLSDRKKGVVVFSVLGIPDHVDALDLSRWTLEGFGEQKAGFYRAYVSQSTGRDDFWDQIAAAQKKMKGRAEGPELPIGNDLVQVYPVQTFLSYLKGGGSDCVVRIVPRLKKDTGKALPREIRQAILEYVPQVDVSRKGKLHFRVTCSGEGTDTAKWFVFEGGADKLARSLSYEESSGSLGEYRSDD